MKLYIKSILAFTLSLSLALFSCSDKKKAEVNHEEKGHTGEEVTLSEEQKKAIKLELGTISYRNLKTSLKANGKLMLPPQNQAQVSLLMGGIVKDIPVTEGMFVKKGQTLAILANIEFLQAQQDLVPGIKKPGQFYSLLMRI